MSNATMESAPPKTAATPGFNGIYRIVDSIQASSNLSPDHKAITVLFDNLLTTTVPQEPVSTRLQTIVLPLENHACGTVHVTQDIRGFVQVAGSAQARLIIHALGKTTVIDPTQSPTTDAAGVPEDTAGGSIAYMTRIESDVPAGSSCRLTLVLLLEHDSPQDTATGLLTVDSLDVAFALAKSSS